MEIDSLQAYIQEIHTLSIKYRGPQGRWPSELLFRGHSDVRYLLLPTIARGRNTSCDVSIFNGERNLVELAKCKYPDIFRDDMKPIELLALLQHHGIPTRLLDVTENALVALYFACCSKPEADGEVFVFLNTDEHIDNAPIISAIADTYRLTRGAQYSLEHFFQAAMNQPYFSEHRHIFEICKEDDHAQRIEGCCSKPLFVHAPVYTLRQQLQQGRFLLFPNRIIDNYLGQGIKAFDTFINKMPKDHDCIKQRITIKKDSKQEILRDLELCGISEATLFFDSVDKVCSGIVDRVRRML